MTKYGFLVVPVMLLWQCLSPCGLDAKTYCVGRGGLSVRQVGGIPLKPGDSIVFESGERFAGSLVLDGISAADRPLVVTSDGNDPAWIDAAGEAAGILIRNSSGIVISNLKITASGSGRCDMSEDPARAMGMRCAVLAEADRPGTYSGIVLENLQISDVFLEDPGFERGTREVRSANGTQMYGWGIRLMVQSDAAEICGVKIMSCRIADVAHTGIKFSGAGKRIRDVEVAYNKVSYTGGPGIQMSGVRDVRIHHNAVDHSGSSDDSRKWGRGSGYWCWNSENIIVEYNRFTNACGPADSAGAHIDYNCLDVVFQYNFSADNAGGFVEILGNNRNCAYRYNISVNDGWRVKGRNGAFQEGKILWLSGYCGKRRRGPYNSYVYNNTIYVPEGTGARFSIENTVSGAMVANNIFYIMGGSSAVSGDQYNPERKGESKSSGVVICNNLYLRSDSLPGEYVDISPVYGDPGFAAPGGYSPEDYIPSRKGPASRGMAIRRIPGDNIGLRAGLAVKTDFLGNRIRKPIIGAVAPYKK